MIVEHKTHPFYERFEYDELSLSAAWMVVKASC